MDLGLRFPEFGTTTSAAPVPVIWSLMIGQPPLTGNLIDVGAIASSVPHTSLGWCNMKIQMIDWRDNSSTLDTKQCGIIGVFNI